MDTDLTLLENKIMAMASLCQQLKRENQQLRLSLSELRGERDRLAGKVSTATQRIETLLDNLPEDTP